MRRLNRKGKKYILYVLLIIIILLAAKIIVRASISKLVNEVKKELMSDLSLNRDSDDMPDKEVFNVIGEEGLQNDGFDNVENNHITVSDYSSPDKYQIKDFPHIYQKNLYPTGCESVAATCLMNYYNYNITVEEFIDNYLPQADEPLYVGDVLTGESPWDYFIGNPYSEYGYGCYSTVIKNAMDAYFDITDSCEVKVLQNITLEELVKEYVISDIPVMIWATMYMWEPEEGATWQLPTGEAFTFIRPEHALILIGYDNDKYYFSDSLDNASVVGYSKEACKRAYEAMGMQALVITQAKNTN